MGSVHAALDVRPRVRLPRGRRRGSPAGTDTRRDGGERRRRREGNDGVDVAKPRDSFSTAACARVRFRARRKPRRKLGSPSLTCRTSSSRLKNCLALGSNATPRRRAVARRVIDAAVGKYLARNPKVRAVASSVERRRRRRPPKGSRSPVPTPRTTAIARVSPLDHVAIRVRTPEHGHRIRRRPSPRSGTSRRAIRRSSGGPMRFPEKKVRARWFRPPTRRRRCPEFSSPSWTCRLSNAARATIEAYVGGTGDGEHGMTSHQSASAALPYDSRRRSAEEGEEEEQGSGPRRLCRSGHCKEWVECVLDLVEDVYATAGDHAAGVASQMAATAVDACGTCGASPKPTLTR